MTTALKHTAFLLLSLATASAGFASDPFAITDDFVAYLKQETNPHDFGLRPDGRFYPYSTPRGRRIGYYFTVWDKALYAQGCTKQEAEDRLRGQAQEALASLIRYIAKTYPDHPFATLSPKSQQMLADYALSEGPENISPAFYDAVIRQDWDRLFDTFIYLRWVEKGWPDNPRNKAFIDRWMDPQLRLRPPP